jgi:autotransporter-associated beta strand protein
MMRKNAASCLICLLTTFVASAQNPEDFYTRTGTDPTFQQLIDSGVILPGESSSPGPVLGSTINVNNTLLEAQTGNLGNLPTDFRIHTQVNSSISRSNFGNFTRWYQEDGRIQVMRLFQGEQNVRSGVGPDGTPGRIEAFFPAFAVPQNSWSVWEGTYTIIDPLQSNIFQLFHEGGQLWAFHLRMTNTGTIYFARRRAITGLPTEITIASNMAGKSISFMVRANGTQYELYKRTPLPLQSWELVTTGSYTPAVDRKISYRWGMYYGSQAGQSIPNDGLLLVNGVKVSSVSAPGGDPPPPPAPLPVTYYWDNNGASAGFGNASGVWGETTSGGTQGWSTDATGVTLPEDVSTNTVDPVFFGTNTTGLGLGAGTITVADTVECADITFGSQSGNITFNGGEIGMSGNRTITLGGTGKTHTIHSDLLGGGGLTIAGGGALVLNGSNTFSGPLVIGNNSESLRLRIKSIANANGTPSAAGAPSSSANGIIQIGAVSNSSTLELTGSTSAHSTNRQIRIGSDSTGSGSATIQNNNANAAHTLTFTNEAFNVAATDTSSFNRTLTLSGSNTGDNTIQGAIINNVGGSGGKVSLTKSGTGTWVLAGTNTYTGTTTISSGTLRIGNGGTTGSLSTSSAIANNGILEIRRSNTTTQGTDFTPGAVSGTGAIVQSGSGTTILNVANTYQGLTTVNAGALRIQHAGALGAAAAGTVVNGTAPSGSPRLELAGGITVTGEAVTLSGGGNFRGALTSQSGSNVWAGNVTIAAPETRIGASDGATLRVSGVIDSGGVAHGINVRGGPGDTGAVIFSGANTYLGDTFLLVGKLQLDGGNNRLPVATRLILGAGSNINEFDLNGRSQEIAGLSIASGATAANNSVNNSSATLSTLTVNTAAGSPSSFAGILKGKMALTKTGPDTLTLTGAHTFSGPTSVNQGTLALTGAGMASPITVASGASLAFTLGSPATSTSSVNLTTGKVKISGSVDNATSYTLITAAGGITGAPVPDAAIPNYELRVQDGGTRLVLVYVKDYVPWAASKASGQGPAEDFDADGVPNGIEFFLNAAPGVTVLPVPDATNTITWPNGGNIPASAYGTRFVVQTSKNLSDWTDVPAGQLTANTDGPGGVLTYTLSGPAPRFVRLKVTP